MTIHDLTNEEKLKASSVSLLLKQPFFGHLLLSRDIVMTDKIPTAATDGDKIYWNADFLASLSLKEVTFVMMHELEHIVFQHMGRRGSRDPSLFNSACDYVINSHIKDIGIGEMPSKALYDRKYDGMISEEVYELLLKDEDASRELQNFDVHMESTLSEAESRAIRGDIRKAKVAGAGNMSKGIQRLFDDFDNSQIDWKEALKRSIEGQIPFDYNMTRRAKRSMSTNFYFPSTTTLPTVECAIAIDTSGSISDDELKTFLSEVNGIINQFPEFKIDIWCFDTEVHNPQQYTTFCEAELKDYQPAGGGGTMFEVNWTFMEKKGIVPKQLIVLTDGYPCGTWGDENYCETIFVITNDITAPFGETINILAGL